MMMPEVKSKQGQWFLPSLWQVVRKGKGSIELLPGPQMEVWPCMKPHF